MPAVTLLLQIGMGIIWDVDSPEAERNKYFVVLEALLWDMGVCGFLQPIAAVFVSCVICPIFSMVVVTGQCLGIGLRKMNYASLNIISEFSFF